jgi:uncharacterized protein with HEPN domain
LIERATAWQTHDGYLDDEWYQSAALYQLERIGEALNQAASSDSGIQQLIPDLREWIGLRNIIAHRYREVQPRLIWDTITREVPELAALLEQLLDQETEREDRSESREVDLSP